MLLPIDLGGMMVMVVVVADINIFGEDGDDDVVMKVLLLLQLISQVEVSVLHIDQTSAQCEDMLLHCVSSPAARDPRERDRAPDQITAEILSFSPQSSPT